MRYTNVSIRIKYDKSIACVVFFSLNRYIVLYIIGTIYDSYINLIGREIQQVRPTYTRVFRSRFITQQWRAKDLRCLRNVTRISDE